MADLDPQFHGPSELQAVMPYNAPTNSFWQWAPNTGTFGAEYAFRDSTNLFGKDCPVWAAQSSCLGATETGLCFSISGVKIGLGRIFEDGFELGNLTAWSTSLQ